MASRGKKSKRNRSTKTPGARPAGTSVIRFATLGTAPLWLKLALPAIVASATLITFLPALDAGFVNWDDDKLFLDNTKYRGLDWAHIEWMFTTTKMGHWQPLSWMTLGLDYTLSGMNPRGYHLTNMILHALGAMAFYLLAMRLLALSGMESGRSPGAVLRIAAALAALFFSMHPLRVESVVWVTERRDLLSGLFFILTILLYLKSHTAERRRWLWFAGAVGVYVLSVLSKAWGMTMPAVLLVLDAYPLRRLGGDRRLRLIAAGRILLEKLPFIIIAAVIAFKAIAAQTGQVDTNKSLAEHALGPRTVQIFYGAAFYVWKTLLPFKLIPLYDLLQVQRNPLELRFVASIVGVLCAVVGLFTLRRRWPAGVALAVAYLAIYSPVSGIAQSGPQLVKDSYSYLCCLSWAVLFGAGLLWCYRRGGPRRFGAGVAVAAVWVAGLGALSWRQAGIWKDSKTLWSYALGVDDDCSLAHNNLAILLKQGKNYSDAISHYERSIELKPKDGDTYFNLGNCLKALKRYDEAVLCYEKAIEYQKSIKGRRVHTQAHVNLGNTYLALENLDGAIEHHRIVAKTRPSADLCNLLGHTLRRRAAERTGADRESDLDEAERLFKKAIKRNSKHVTALCNLAELLIDRGRCAESLTYLERARRIKPTANRPRELLARAETECSR